MSESLSVWQERALAITPKCSASLSMPCSMFIIYEVFCDHRACVSNAIQRALVGMSSIDILASSAWFLSTWAVPRGSFAYSKGNRASCTYQGFMLQLAIGAPLYNCSLALYYLLIIKKRWSDEMLARIEKWVHAFVLSFSIGTSILLLSLKQYNHIGTVCWVIGEPEECGHSSYQTSDVPCKRGDYAWIYGVALFYGPLWICIVACVTSMVVIYQEVKKTHARLHRYTCTPGSTHSLGRSAADSSRVAQRAILYSLSFLVTWMPSTLWSIAHWFNWGNFWLDFAASVCEPLQGFWNLMIFIRRRPRTQMKVRKMVAFVFPCCCYCCCTVGEEEEPRPSFISTWRSRLSSSRLSISKRLVMHMDEHDESNRKIEIVLNKNDDKTSAGCQKKEKSLPPENPSPACLDEPDAATVQSTTARSATNENPEIHFEVLQKRAALSVLTATAVTVSGNLQDD